DPGWPASGGAAARNLESLWADLAGEEDASTAFDSVLTLAARPAEAVPLLRRHLRPVPAVEAAKVARWVAELDSDDFAVRERARGGVDGVGEVAVPALRDALAGSSSPEKRRRIAELLDRHGRPEEPGAQGLRRVRAVEALERMGTAEARRLLEDLVG